MGVSGESLRESLLTLRPEIYGSIAEDKIELNGLLYVMDRLPYGIEECSYINLTSNEGYSNSHFKPIVPHKRRRNCYRIDDEQMNIEVTRGRSEIYDILTHLTFLFIESHKIMRRVLVNDEDTVIRDWKKVEDAVKKGDKLTQIEKEIAITHVANILGRTFEEVNTVFSSFSCEENPNRFISIIYHLGRLALDEHRDIASRLITFSPVLRERLGHHIHGEIWANDIKKVLFDKGLLKRPIHIISANMHSVMNTLYSAKALAVEAKKQSQNQLYEALSQGTNKALRDKVSKYAKANGMLYLSDVSGTNIDIQIFDTAKIDTSLYTAKDATQSDLAHPIILVMDYAFGEQAYETMDELLKPYICDKGKKHFLEVESVSIMGKAGILEGDKGDIMIPKAHIFEGTADNYPIKNRLKKSHFDQEGVNVCNGAMITVLGTSLQNKDILQFFYESTWNVIGLEMEGAHYQKAIQAAAKIRGSISSNVQVRYAYYASDNPLKTGSTLASGGLGTTGVRPTYLITQKILEQILS